MVDAGEDGFSRISKTLCPSGLRGWTQVPLAQAAWVQIPQLSFFLPESMGLPGPRDAEPTQHIACAAGALGITFYARKNCSEIVAMTLWPSG